jgi:hypothetical protein
MGELEVFRKRVEDLDQGDSVCMYVWYAVPSSLCIYERSHCVYMKENI